MTDKHREAKKAIREYMKGHRYSLRHPKDDKEVPLFRKIETYARSRNRSFAELLGSLERKKRELSKKRSDENFHRKFLDSPEKVKERLGKTHEFGVPVSTASALIKKLHKTYGKKPLDKMELEAMATEIAYRSHSNYKSLHAATRKKLKSYYNDSEFDKHAMKYTHAKISTEKRSAAVANKPKRQTAKQRLTKVINTQNTIFANKGKTKTRKLTIAELRTYMRKDGLLSSWDDTAHLEKKIRQALNAKYKASKLKAQKAPSNFLDDAKKDLHKKFEPKQEPKAKAAPKAHTLDTIIDEVVNTAKSKHGRIGLGIGAGAVGIAAYLNRDK